MKSHFSNTNNPIDFTKTENKMNERIKLLAEQSLPNVKFWNEEITKGNTPPKGRAITLNELEKFAELIVRECAEKCVYVVDRQEILAHFGVEE